jgi:hypothetical protein
VGIDGKLVIWSVKDLKSVFSTKVMEKETQRDGQTQVSGLFSPPESARAARSALLLCVRVPHSCGLCRA